MSDERVEVPAGAVARWLLVALVILAGIGLFLWNGPATLPIAPPAGWEGT
jgi:hypothetical protein